MLFVERLTLNLDEVIAALRVNERMIRTENINDEHHAIVVVKSEQGRIIQGDMMSKEEDQNRNYVHNEI